MITAGIHLSKQICCPNKWGRLYVHMWFHPHNLITAPAMRWVFADLMREVGQWVRTGDLVNLTIAEANDYFTTGRAG